MGTWGLVAVDSDGVRRIEFGPDRHSLPRRFKAYFNNGNAVTLTVICGFEGERATALGVSVTATGDRVITARDMTTLELGREPPAGVHDSRSYSARLPKIPASIRPTLVE